MPPVINEKKCKRCGVCADICPEDVFFGSVKGELPMISHPEVCWHCSACVVDCPVKGAIRVRTPLTMFIPYR